MTHSGAVENWPMGKRVVTCETLDRLGLWDVHAGCCRSAHNSGCLCDGGGLHVISFGDVTLEVCHRAAETLDWTAATFHRVFSAAEPLYAAE